LREIGATEAEGGEEELTEKASAAIICSIDTAPPAYSVGHPTLYNSKKLLDRVRLDRRTCVRDKPHLVTTHPQPSRLLDHLVHLQHEDCRKSMQHHENASE
jgi:hypothetical protein